MSQHKIERIILVTLVAFFLVSLNLVFAQSPALTQPDIYVSSYSLQQSDTLLVIVKNEPNEITGRFGYLPLHFFRSEDGKSWIAIAGMHVKKFPGNYYLTITSPGKARFRKLVSVLRRNFTVTKLVVTPDLSAKGYTDKNIVNNVINDDNKKLKEALSTYTPSIYSPKPFIYPLSEIKVTGDYGDIRKSGSYSIQHLGVDLKAVLDTPVYATNDGKVAFEGNLVDYGNTLVIDHGLGVYSLYLHLNSFKVNVGDIVKQGDTIALSGSTGYAIGPHLHFSINIRGASVDPLKFIETTKLITNN